MNQRDCSLVTHINLLNYDFFPFYVPVCEDTAAESSYILPFSAAMQRDNFYATQFHPEKSGDPGELILKQFLKLW